MWNPFSKTWVGRKAMDVTGEQWFNLVTLPEQIRGNVEHDGVLSLKEMSGYVILLHFWSSSCTSCVRALPQVHQLWDTHRASNFFVVGIHTPDFSYEGDDDQIKQSIIKFGVSYPVVNDAGLVMWDRYKCKEKPRYTLIDKNGRIVADQVGSGGLTDISAQISDLLAG